VLEVVSYVKDVTLIWGILFYDETFILSLSASCSFFRFHFCSLSPASPLLFFSLSCSVFLSPSLPLFTPSFHSSFNSLFNSLFSLPLFTPTFHSLFSLPLFTPHLTPSLTPSFHSLFSLPLFTPSLSDIIELHNGIWRTTIKDDGTGVVHTICLPLIQCNARSPRSVQSNDFRYAFHRYVPEL
jgi:hypothetical protein